MDEMVELIKGMVFRQARAAFRGIHQKISGKVFAKVFNFLEERYCGVYEVPFHVQLPVKSKSISGFQLDLEYVFRDLD